MVDVAEHVYDDDPLRGHPDVRTRLAGVSYYLLGNGLIQAAVQHAPGGEGTPLGLLVMDPDRLRKKRESLTMDPARGLEPTMARVCRPGGDLEPTPGTLVVSWVPGAAVPTVRASWGGGGLVIHETFSCPPPMRARLVRHIELHNYGTAVAACTLRVGAGRSAVARAFSLAPDERAGLTLAYDLDAASGSVSVAELDGPDVPDSTGCYWSNRTSIAFNEPTLDHLFHASRVQLPAAISAGGCMDGSIWQYNREWVRDQAFVVQALTMLGHRERAATMLRRLLTSFVTPDGATLDSSEIRARDDVELDQNGILLYVIREYVNWTGDERLLSELWDRISAIADYPLRAEFRHEPSGLVSGCREFWERHAAHGIEPGLEMIYQVFVAMGLEAAADLARRTERHADADRWKTAAARLRMAALTDPAYAMHDARGFIKRRRLDGSLQETIVPRADAGLPPGSPLTVDEPHRLNPDTCAVLPIAFGFVESDSVIARATLASMEGLWSQRWTGGGYGRYDVTSEPDSPGAWPFASLFVARAGVEAGDPATAWRVLRWLNQAAGAPSGAWFEFNGPRPSPPFPQVGIIPWTWAEVTLLLVRHVLGIRPGDTELRVRPRLLPGLTHVHARLPLREGWLRLDLRASPDAPADREFVVPYAPGEMAVTGTARAIT
jgi:hypothetical protein